MYLFIYLRVTIRHITKMYLTLKIDPIRLQIDNILNTVYVTSITLPACPSLEFFYFTIRKNAIYHKMCIGVHKMCIGVYKMCIGAYKMCIGAYTICIGAYKMCIGAYKMCIGAYKICIGAYKVVMFKVDVLHQI